MPRNATRPAKPARRAPRRTTLLAALADPATKHYVGVAVVLLALALAYFVAHAHHIKAWSFEVSRTEQPPAR
jgi:membrane protein YdbS with pleckstrin-like domain